MRPLSPWDLARSADGFAREAGEGGSDGAGTDGLLAVGGTVVLRAPLVLGLVSVAVTVVPPGWAGVLALMGIVVPVAYTGAYLRASTPAGRGVLLASLRRGYRISVFLLVVVAAVLVRVVGLRLGWVVADPPPPQAWALAAGVAVVVAAQTGALRRRARRGPG